MEPLVWLLLLSAAMLLGSYVAGSLPLSIKLSERKIRLFNALGAGLLIGTSLMVVIPEGVETIYNSKVTAVATPRTNVATLPNWPSLDIDQGSSNNWVSQEEEDDDSAFFQIVKRRSPAEKEVEEEEEEGGEHTAIGLALIFGFALMFVIDQVSSLHLPAPNNNPSVEYTELNTVVGGGSLEREEEQQQHRNTTTTATQSSCTPIVGLVVHAAADGIALGASAAHPQLSVVVFLAIMLHKAPASFALTSVLLASGELSQAEIRKHLALFAFAAPTGALLTYFILHLFSSGSFVQANLEYWTGVLLVFSGGTFLYVAMHALQEVSHTHTNKENRAHLLITLAGMAIPVLLSMTHSH